MAGEANHERALRALKSDAQREADQADTIHQQRQLIEKLQQIEKVQRETLSLLEKRILADQEVESCMAATAEVLRHRISQFEELLDLKDTIIKEKDAMIQKYRWLDAYLDQLTKPPAEQVEDVHV